MEGDMSDFVFALALFFALQTPTPTKANYEKMHGDSISKKVKT